MFKVKQFCTGAWMVVNVDGEGVLHSDGNLYTTAEYLPTEKLAQALLDKFQPKHVWEHGDVFINALSTPMICIGNLIGAIKVFCITGMGCDCNHNAKALLETGKFLFNIKEKLSQKVFIITENYDYEGGNIVGVYSTRKRAEKVQEVMEVEKHPCDFVEIEEQEVL